MRTGCAGCSSGPAAPASTRMDSPSSMGSPGSPRSKKTLPRVGKKFLYDEEGVRVRLRSPNLRRALTETGVTVEDLRAKDAAALQRNERKPVPPEAMQRRVQATEVRRRQHFREVMLARENYIAARLAGQAAERQRRDEHGTPEAPDVDAAVRADQAMMAAQLEKDKERMERAKERAMKEAQEARDAAEREMQERREFERHKKEKAERTRIKRAAHQKERLERDEEREAAIEAARNITHQAQREFEAYTENWEESYQGRHKKMSDDRFANNRAHLRRVADLKARERERDAQRNQRQLDLEAQNVAHLRAHQVRVDRYHARIRQDMAKRGEEVAAKHKQAMQARQDYQDSLIRRDEEQAEAFRARLLAVERANAEAEEAERKEGKLKEQKWERIRASNEQAQRAKEEEKLERAEEKDQRIAQKNHIQKTSMAVRAEESRLRRAKVEDGVQRMERRKHAHKMEKLQQFDRQDQAWRDARAAQEKIKNNRKQMVRQFFVERRKMKEEQNKFVGISF